MSIAAVVQEHVGLKRYGRSLKGLCPFHAEKTPSFHVDEAKGFYYCFGCQAGGDVFKFLMQVESSSFPEAVRQVAQKGGLAVPERRPAGPRDELRESIFEINQAAQACFAQRLLAARTEDGGGQALDYLARRGIGREIVEGFGLGWASKAWDGLQQDLGERFERRALTASGLLVAREDGGVHDRFRARVTFPIRALSERVVGFGGRLVAEGEPKYVNSPETPVYSKGQQLFGLDRARSAIRRQGEALLVEGYLDAISLHAAGVEHAVAVLGTALTPQQARLLGRFTKRVVLNFDGDEAGRRATRRSIDVLLEEGLDVRVLELPQGTDPDDFVRARGAEEYLRELERASSFFDFLLRTAATEHDLAGPSGRVDALGDVLPYLVRLQDRVLRSELADAAADGLRLPRHLVQDDLRRRFQRGRRKDDAAPRQAQAPISQAERILISWLVNDEEVRRSFRAAVPFERLGELDRPELFRALHGASEESFSLVQVLESIDDEEEAALLTRCALDGESVPVVREALDETVGALLEGLGLSERRSARQRKVEVERELAQAIEQGDAESAGQLRDELHQLVKTMHS